MKKLFSVALCLCMLLALAIPTLAAAPTDPKQIVDEAFALESGAKLDYSCTLTGKISSIPTPYSEQYKNITVNIEVEGTSGKKELMCYRMKGDGAADLEIGDTITVTGTIKNYNGTIEFDTGCTLDKVEKGNVVVPEDPKEIVDAAFALAEGEKLDYLATLTGLIKSIDEPYTDQYKNITLTIIVEGTDGDKDLVVYRMKGEGIETLKVGDTIKVTGQIKNYKGTVEFDLGTQFGGIVEVEPEVPGEDPDDIPTTGDTMLIPVMMMLIVLSASALVVMKKKAI